MRTRLSTSHQEEVLNRIKTRAAPRLSRATTTGNIALSYHYAQTSPTVAEITELSAWPQRQTVEGKVNIFSRDQNHRSTHRKLREGREISSSAEHRRPEEEHGVVTKHAGKHCEVETVFRICHSTDNTTITLSMSFASVSCDYDGRFANYSFIPKEDTYMEYYCEVCDVNFDGYERLPRLDHQS